MELLPVNSQRSHSRMDSLPYFTYKLYLLLMNVIKRYYWLSQHFEKNSSTFHRCIKSLTYNLQADLAYVRYECYFLQPVYANYMLTNHSWDNVIWLNTSSVYSLCHAMNLCIQDELSSYSQNCFDVSLKFLYKASTVCLFIDSDDMITSYAI